MSLGHVLSLHIQKVPLTRRDLGKLCEARSKSWPLWDFLIHCFYNSTRDYRCVKKYAPHLNTHSPSPCDIVMTCHLEKPFPFYSQNREDPSIHPSSFRPFGHHPSIYSPHHKLFLRTLSCDTDSTNVGEIHINQIVFLCCWVILQSGRSWPQCRVSDIHAGSCRELRPCFIGSFGCTFIYFKDP